MRHCELTLQADTARKSGDGYPFDKALAVAAVEVIEGPPGSLHESDDGQLRSRFTRRAPKRLMGGVISMALVGHRVSTMPGESMGQDDEVADAATLDAALSQILNNFNDPGGFFTLAEDPDRLDSELQERYVGMSAEDAASAAIRDGITQIRVIRLPLTTLRTDHYPDRLNLAVIDGRVIRVAFF